MVCSWRTTAVALALALAALAATASAQVYTFADIQWGSSAPKVISALQSRGYKNVSLNSNGDIAFAGTYAGLQAVGSAIMGNGGLLKVVYNIITPDERAMRCYTDLRETLVGKHGAPSMNVRNFTTPYFDGDGFEETAIKTGKAQISTIWLAADCEACGMMVSVTETLTVLLTYESPEWNLEADRRSAAAADDF